MIRKKRGVTRFVHPARKLEKPVLEAGMPWEIGDRERFLDKRVNICVAVMREEKTAINSTITRRILANGRRAATTA